MSDSKEKNKGGRPTKYKEEYAEQARKICLLGATDEFLANYFEVSVSTLNKWKIEHPQFSEALKKGKEEADLKVAESLFSRACGYSHEETKLCQHEGAFTDEKKVIKHYAPDPTAAIFWLKNRQKEVWRDKQEHDVNIVGSADAWADDEE